MADSKEKNNDSYALSSDSSYQHNRKSLMIGSLQGKVLRIDGVTALI